MTLHTLKNLFSPDFKPGIKIKNSYLFYISVLTVLSILVTYIFTEKEKVVHYNEMVAAAEKMQIASNENQSFRLEKNIPVYPLLDPSQSGFIGEEFSAITTTLGNLESKQTAVNPDFAALMVYWIKDMKLEPSSDIIIHASASFPALTIMAIIACETLDMNPVILSSVGASSYGANIPDLTYLDIENHLFTKEIIKNRSSFNTPGGNQDNGSSLWEGGLEIVKNAAITNEYELYVAETIEEAIESKWQFCFNNLQPVLFINIGGNHAAMGNGNCSLEIPTGKIMMPLKCNDNGTGLIHKFSNAGIPVFHFLNIRDLAIVNGISLTPGFVHEPGQADLYYIESKPIWILATSLITILLLIFISRTKNTL